MIDVTLKITLSNDAWTSQLVNSNGDILENVKVQIVDESILTKEYFDELETQIKMFPNYNIISVERFI